MTRQNASEEQQDVSAAQTRVKREELAKAIASLEARRQEEARQREGTVAVGDVVTELQMDVSPEEILQEIQVQRRGLPPPAKVRRTWDTAKRTEIGIIGTILLLPALVLIIAASVFRAPAQAPQNPRPPMLQPFTPVYGQLPGTSSFFAIDPDESRFDTSSVLKPLASIPESQPIYCSSASLSQLLQSHASPDSSQQFDVRPHLHRPWTIFKQSGRIYLRAWVAGRFTSAEAQGHIATLHATLTAFDLGTKPTCITVPLTFEHYTLLPPLQLPDGIPSSPTLLVGDLSLDQNAWEKWQ